MADKNNFGDIQDSFNYIADVLDSMRAQNAMNAGNIDKLMQDINSRLEEYSQDDSIDFMKVFLAELKRSLDERHGFVSLKFSEIDYSFKEMLKKSENQLTGPEIKELFEIIATNLGSFSKDFSAQKNIVSEIGLKLEELQRDDSAKREILKNISTLKNESERIGNGFESIIININDNFNKLSKVLGKLDNKETLDSLKKDIENIFLSSNAILSTMQVIDKKNREFEDTISTFITKEDFSVEREQVAKLIAQNIQLTDYIKNLPTQDNFESLTEKIDTSIGVINALKNMLSETSKQNQQILTAQLDSLETKILNISTEEEFIGFRKELSEFAKEVMENTNLIRADLADTNSSLKNLYEFLNAMDIKNSFLNFTEITKSTEKALKDTVASSSARIADEIVKNQRLSKSELDKSVALVSDRLESVKDDIEEKSKNNLSNILENIQSVLTNIFSVKEALMLENASNIELLEGKFDSIREEVSSTGGIVIKSSRENLSSILVNLEKMFNEISEVKKELSSSEEKSFGEIASKFSQVESKIDEAKNGLAQNAQNSLSSITSIIGDLSQKLTYTSDNLAKSYGSNSTEIKEIIGGLSLKLTSLQEVLVQGSEVGFEEIKSLMQELTSINNSVRNTVEKTTTFGFSGITATLGDISGKIKEVENSFEYKSNANLEKIVALFSELNSGLDSHKNFLSESVQASFESVSVYVQNLNKVLDETKAGFDSKMDSQFSRFHDSISEFGEISNSIKRNQEVFGGQIDSKISQVYSSISELSVKSEEIKQKQDSISHKLDEKVTQVCDSINVLPEAIRENQLAFENEKKILIEENSQNIKELNEKVQNLILGVVSKDNSFKEDVSSQFSELKASLDVLKRDFSQAASELEDNLGNQVTESIETAEKIANQCSETYNKTILELQNRISGYFESIKEINSESDAKLNNSLREAYEIKSDINELIQLVSSVKNDSSLADFASDINNKFDSILIDFSQMEESVVSKNYEAINGSFAGLDSKFESVLSEIRTYKELNSSIPREIISDLEEKTENLKVQINLAGTDVINVVSSRSGEIISRLISLSESIETISQVDFEGAFSELKSRLDNSTFMVTSAIKQDLEKNNFEQSAKIEKDFENVSEKLNIILAKVSSDNTKEIGELKSILTDRVDNISSINSILGNVLEKLEEMSSISSVIHNVVSGAKEEVLEKINVFEDILLQSQEDSKSALGHAVIESQNRITSSVSDKIAQTAEDSRAFIANEIYQSKIEAQNAISAIKENILSLTSSFDGSLDASLNNLRADLLERVNNAESSLMGLQDDNKYAIVDEINRLQEETKEFVAEAIENSAQSVQRAISGKIIEAQESSKDRILNEISDSNDKARASLLYGVKESLSGVSSSISEATEESILASKTEISEQIASLEDKVLESQGLLKNSVISEITQNVQEISALVNKIEEKQYDNTSVLNNLAQAQLESKSFVEQSLRVDEEVKNVVDEISQKQNSTRSLVDGISRGQQDLAVSVDSLSQSNQEIKNIVNEVLENQSVVTEVVSDKLDVSVQNIQIAVSNKILETQEGLKEGLLAEMSDSNDKAKASILYGVKESFANAGSSLNSSTKEIVSEIKSEISEKIDNIENQILSSQEDLKQDLLDNMSAQISEVVDNQKGNSSILDNLSSSQHSIKNSVNEIIQNQADTDEIISEKLEQAKEEIQRAVVNRVIEAQDNFKDVILNELAESEDKSKAATLYGIRESVANANSNINEMTKEAVSELEVSLISKISGFESNSINLQEDVKKAVGELVQNQTAMAEVQENAVEIQRQISESVIDIAQEQAELKTSVEEIISNQSSVSESISEKLEQSTQALEKAVSNKILETQNDLKEALLEDLADAEEKSKAAVLYGIKESVANANSNINEVTKEAVSELGSDLSSKIVDLEDKILEAQNELRAILEDSTTSTMGDVSGSVEQIIQKQDDNSAILTDAVRVQEQTKNLVNKVLENQEETECVLDKITQDQNQNKSEIIESINSAQSEFKFSILDRITQLHSETESSILGELEENIKVVKEVLATLSSEPEVEQEDSQKIDELKAVLEEISQNIENKIEETEQNYKTSTQSMLSEVKTSFYDKVEDSLDGLKSFLELFESKIDFGHLIEDLKFDVSNKIEEIGTNLEFAITTVSVKDELQDVSAGIESSIDKLFEDVKEELVVSLENCEAIKNVSEKTEEIQRNIETLKSAIVEDISSKLNEFELTVINNKSEISELIESVKVSIDELRENYVDLSINSNMEISTLLLTIKDEIAVVQDKLSIDVKDSLKENFEKLENKIENLNISKALEESNLSLKGELEILKGKIETIVDNSSNEFDIEGGIGSLKQEVEAVSQKIDLLALESSAESDVEQGLDEIKQILNTQAKFITKLEKFEGFEELSKTEALTEAKEEIQSVIKATEAKLEELINTFKTQEDSAAQKIDIKSDLATFKEEIVENLINIFNDISFVVEAEEIKEFVDEKLEEVRDDVKESIQAGLEEAKDGIEDKVQASLDEVKAGIEEVKNEIQAVRLGSPANAVERVIDSQSNQILEESFENNFENVLSSLDILHEKTNKADTNYVDIKKEIEEVKEHLLASKTNEADEQDYSYTLEDIESDIAKVRMILKDISEAKPSEINIDGLDKLDKLDKLNDLEKLSEDITSISTRTNKLLLNSDESYSSLQENLSDLKSVISQFEKKVKVLENKEPINKIERKLEDINNLVVSNVQSDKVFNQAFMYLAEWIDRADEKMSELDKKVSDVAFVKQNMIKKSDLESMFDKFVKKIDKQQEKIKLLEDKIDKLTKEKKVAPKQTEIKSIINEVLSKIEKPSSRPDSILAKKVDGIDRQLATLGKNIEKITSYVD